MIRHEIIAYALAHFIATVDLSPDDDTVAMDLLYAYGDECGIDVPLGDEYQRAVLHHFDPERVPDFPLEES